MRALRIVLWFLVFELVVVIATGVAQFFFYRPSSGLFIRSSDELTPVSFSDVMRVTHRASALLLIVTAITATVLGVFALRSARGRWTIGGAGIAMAVGAVGAWSTGFLLAWDQLALWAVTIGTDLSGARAVFRDEVKFVLVGAREISPGSYIAVLVIHAALAVALVLLLGLAWTAVSRREAQRG